MEPTMLAHVGPPEIFGPRNWSELARAWEWEPFALVPLLITAWLYRRGVRRLWGEAGRGRGLRGWEVGAFWAGWWTLAVALLSPLHPWGKMLFAAHMTQHELLMLVAAPLLVLGRPMVALLFAVPRGDARQISRAARVPILARTWRGLTHPMVAWALHATALWIWHVPSLFQATLTSDLAHDLQHASFFGSALLFWWALIHGRAGLVGFGAAALYLFTTMAHSGALGALLTFSEHLLYPAYAGRVSQWGLTPIEDQQLGGLIMWIPAGLVYVVAALAMIAGWMRTSDRRLARWLNQEVVTRVALIAVGIVAFSGCGHQREEEAAAMTGGDPRVGREVIVRVGCGACHSIPGIVGADGQVGPPLEGIASRTYIGGVLTNTPDNVVKWIQDPLAHSPKTAMPKLDLSEKDARDVTAYLYTLTN